jgi:hypothetical protein
LHGDNAAQRKIDWITHTTVTLEINLTAPRASLPIKLQCRHFKPNVGDVVTKYAGEMGEIAVPSYAATDLKAFGKDLLANRKELRNTFLLTMIHNGCSEVVIETFRAAFRYAVSFFKSHSY